LAHAFLALQRASFSPSGPATVDTADGEAPTPDSPPPADRPMSAV
jgi:hypothetical protein